MRKPAFSKRSLIAPVRLRRVASGLMIDSVRSMAMGGSWARGGAGYSGRPWRRAEPLGLLSPPRFGLLPIGQRVAAGLGAAPAAPRRLDRDLIVAVEHVDTAGILRHIVSFDAIDEKEDGRAVRVLGAVAEP